MAHEVGQFEATLARIQAQEKTCTEDNSSVPPPLRHHPSSLPPLREAEDHVNMFGEALADVDSMISATTADR